MWKKNNSIVIVLEQGIFGEISRLVYSNFQNGYKARLVKMENCGGDDQVMKIDPNVTLSMNKACELILVGCAETTGFATAEVTKLN